VRTDSRNSDNLALTRQIFGSFKEKGMDAVMTAMHPDVEAHLSIGGAPVLSGRDALARWWNDFASVNGTLEVRPLDFEPRGNCVIVRGYLRHRQGRTLAESQMYWLFEVCDGQIVRMESHPTRDAALTAC
jgi:ketosteroid isomerase-like protein